MLIRAFTLALFAAVAPAQITHLSASLDGAQENPPVVSSGRGFGLVRVDASTGNVRIFVHTTLGTAVAAHMHRAAVGANGPIVIGLAGGPLTWTGTGTLSPADVALLLADGMYLNVHTGAHPSGEIRGQVVAAKATRYVATLDGSQETPPNGSTASGTGIAFLHQPDNVLTYAVDTQGLTNVAAAHIHDAPAGVAGPIVFPLNGTNGTYCGVTPKLTSAQLAALQAGRFYFNIHTSAFPGGEIRGQIAASVADFSAAMDGAQENPPVVTNAFGEACLVLNPDNTLTYRVATSGLTGVAAHIHKGAVGVNGGVEIPLAGGPTIWSGTSGPLTAAQIADGRNGLWYVNVHTAGNPSGEIRGQVAIANLPTTYGNGCPGSAGNYAEIGSDRAACIGSRVPITLHGAAPTTQAAALIGLDRDTLSGVPLPIDLVLISMPTCFLLHDLLGPSLNTTTDANGCARVSLTVPLDPNLRQLPVYATWFIIDLGANPLNVVTSNALELRLE